MHDDEWSVPVTRTRTAEIDETEVRRAIAVLFHPEHYHLIQSLPSGRWRYTHASDIQAIGIIRDRADELGCYFSLNAIKSPLDHCLNSSDVSHRQWFLIDIDTNRPDTNVMATDEEREASRMVAVAVNQHLTEQGWPAAVSIDSGNGWHLLYCIDLPADKHTQAILRNCLKRLAEKFDNKAAHIDRGTHDAKRISKLPGTWVRKGVSTDDRPHRVARMLHAPEAIECVPVELLMALAAIPPKKKEQPKPPPAPPSEWLTPTTKVSTDAYLERALQNELTAFALVTDGHRNNALNKAAFSLGQLIVAGLNRGRVETSLRTIAESLGLGHEEIEKTLRSGIEAGLANPRSVPERKQILNGKHHALATELKDGESIVIRASEIKPKVVPWLMPGRIPIHFITIFAGRTGLGKSFVTCDIMARLTTGRELPGSPPFEEIGNVLMVSEDSHEYMLAPRLIAANADMSRVHFMTWKAMAFYTLDNIEMLTAAWEQSGQPILIGIDPPTNFLGQCDEHKNAEVRAVLMRLVDWLQDRRVAVVLITHNNKQVGKGLDAINRVMGSAAWVSTSRIAHSFAEDPNDFSRCLFVPMKNNLGPLAKGLAYRIETIDGAAQVVWLEEVDTTANEAMGNEPRKPRHVAAREWLETVAFKDRREWPSDEIVRAAREAGVNRNALWEAKGILPIKARKTITADGDSIWIWQAEIGWPSDEFNELDNIAKNS